MTRYRITSPAGGTLVGSCWVPSGQAFRRLEGVRGLASLRWMVSEPETGVLVQPEDEMPCFCVLAGCEVAIEGDDDETAIGGW